MVAGGGECKHFGIADVCPIVEGALTRHEEPSMYIDPGSGSMLVQVLIASAIGSLIAFRKTLFQFISRFKSGPPPPEDGAN